MLAFCGPKWLRNPEFPEKTTDLARAYTTLPHAAAGDQTRVAAVTNEGFTPGLSRPHSKLETTTLHFVYYTYFYLNVPVKASYEK